MSSINALLCELSGSDRDILEVLGGGGVKGETVGEVDVFIVRVGCSS